jgi:hypothetical protein
VRDGWLRWLTADGVVVPTPLERGEQERQRAEQEYQRAEKERQRAEQAVQQAEQAIQRAEQAEQLLAAYQRRFGNLDAPS